MMTMPHPILDMARSKIATPPAPAPPPPIPMQQAPPPPDPSTQPVEPGSPITLGMAARIQVLYKGNFSINPPPPQPKKQNGVGLQPGWGGKGRE